MKNLCILLVLLSLAGCATAPSSQYPVYQNTLKQLCEKYAIRWQVDGISQVITLYRDGNKAKALVGSSLVIVNDQRVHLTSAIQRVRDMVVVPPDFKRRVIDPLIKKHAIQSVHLNKVVVDPGHGGKDPGAIGISGTQEKKIVLDVAKKLKKILEKNGVKVVLTRSKDKFIALEDRAQKASQVGVDLFVSIHANSAPQRSVSGMEVFYLRYLDPDEWYQENVMDNAGYLFDRLKMNKDSQDLQDVLVDMLYNQKRGASQHLAECITQEASISNDLEVRGIKTAGFHVLRNTMTPAVLVEIGFLSNPKEEKKLKSSTYQQKIAENIARSILKYAEKK